MSRVQAQPLALEDLALPIERHVIGVLADQSVAQKTGLGAAAFDGRDGSAAWCSSAKHCRFCLTPYHTTAATVGVAACRAAETRP